MAGNAIGTGAVILTANADGLAAGLAQASKDVGKWGAGVNSALKETSDGSKGIFGRLASGIGGAIGTVFGGKGVMSGLQTLGGQVAGQISGVAAGAKGLLTTAGAAIGTALGGPIGAAIGGAVGGAVGELGVVVAGALGSPFEKINEFAGVVKKASILGISASQYQGFTQELRKVGIEGEQVDTIFAKLGNTITKAQFGDPTAAVAFERLGLDVEKLASQSLDKSFLDIATAINENVGPAAQQAHAAFALFGKAGAQLLPTLQKGGGAIQEFIDQQKKLGTVLSDSQLEAAANASKAWKGAKIQIAAAWDGLVNRATLIAAPIIQFAGRAVSKAFTLLTPVFEWVGRAVETVADIATAVFEQLERWFTEAVDWVKTWGAELGAFTGEWPTVRTVVIEVFRGIGIAAALAWDTVKLGAGAIATVAGWMIEKGGSIVTVFRTLVDLLKKLPDSAKPSWLNGFIDGVDRADDRFRQFGTDMKNWGVNAVTSWGQSAQMLSDWIDRLNGRKKNLAAQAKPLGDDGVAKVADVWRPAKLAGAIEAGTKEAYSIVAKQIYGDYGAPIDEHKKNGKKIDKTNDLLKQIQGQLGALSGAIEGI